MICQIVIGLGFGDEAKGQLTDTLCRQADRPLVVRFSGGHQAGHTVVTENGQRHVFSNFGAGTLAGAATFWSNYCTFHPIGYANELAALRELNIEPLLYVDGKAAVTTPYDLLYNRQRETQEKHGSCGLGFGATVARHEGPHKIHVQDLLDDFVFEQKMASVAAYYREKLGINYEEEILAAWLERFDQAVSIVRRHLRISSARAFFQGASERYDKIIFEGSQGLLLDEEFGYFPHVTRARVSTANALALIQSCGLADLSICTSAGGTVARDTLALAQGRDSELQPCESRDWEPAQEQAFPELNQPNSINCRRTGEVDQPVSATPLATLKPAEVQIHYITRAYQTRHGNGPMTNEHLTGLELQPTPYETNQYNEWQGEQRRSLLDVDQLRYALQCDAHYSAGLPRYLNVSCLDQLAGPWRATDQEQLVELEHVAALGKRIGGEWAGVFSRGL